VRRNFCPPASFGWWMGVRQDFVQNGFEFYPKDTANNRRSEKYKLPTR